MKYLKKLDIKLVKGKYKNLVKGQVREPKQVFEVFESIKDKAHETLIGLYLSKDLEALAYNILSTGSQEATVFDVNDIYGYGFVMKSKYFILIHNHPSGNLKPSKADERLMKELTDYSKLKVKLKPLDFIIVGDLAKKREKNYWSMLEQEGTKEYPPYKFLILDE